MNSKSEEEVALMLVDRIGGSSRAVAIIACAILAVRSPEAFAQQTFVSPNAVESNMDSAPANDDPALVVSNELSEEDAYTAEELEALVAPIALYPDPLLVHVLLAATYPLDAVRAHRFVQTNEGLDPEELISRAETEGWDPSVVSLIAFPTVLDRMATDLDWTERLGEAMVLQSDDVLDAVQTLRDIAQTSGALETNEHQVVSQDEENTIAILPAEPEVIYVPQYEPQRVFVPQPTTTTAFSNTGYSDGAVVAAGLVGFTSGVILGRYFGRSDRYYYYWGRPRSQVVWHHRRIYPPYYRPGGYRPPYYRPRPPGFRPGDAWRPRPELYRDVRVKVDTRQRVTRDIDRRVNVGSRDRVRLTPSDRASLQRQLKDRGRDRPATVRPGKPQRLPTRDGVRPRPVDRPAAITRPTKKDTAFDDRKRQSEVRKNRDRAAASRDRANGLKRPTTRPRQQSKPSTVRPNQPKRPAATTDRKTARPAPAITPKRPAFENRGGTQAKKFSNRGKTSSTRASTKRR